MTYAEELKDSPERYRPRGPPLFLLAIVEYYCVNDVTDGEEALFIAGENFGESLCWPILQIVD
jgi:hypothetical protein